MLGPWGLLGGADSWTRILNWQMAAAHKISPALAVVTREKVFPNPLRQTPRSYIFLMVPVKHPE